MAVANLSNASGNLSVTRNTLVLTKATEAQEAIKFNFTAPDFGYEAAVTNTLQFGLKGTNFANAKEVTLPTRATSKAYTGLELNALLLTMNLPFNALSDVDVRVKSSISSNVAPVFSNVTALKVTPYPLISFIYVPGAYQGWNPATAESLISATSNGIYEGIINFPSNGLSFKMLTNKSWGPPEYGAGSVAGSIAIGGGDLSAPAAGSYRLIANLNANTLVFEPFSFGVIGNATPGGWTTDTDMTYNNGTRTWSVTLPLTVGVIKFRKNDDWGTNYGGANGELVSGGGDIDITTAGTYRVSFSTVTNTYTITRL
ncbi:SusE domain-containing protein [Pedobacter aquae]|nr:SusE domain-containing protein [Pedobacter aquae]